MGRFMITRPYLVFIHRDALFAVEASVTGEIVHLPELAPIEEAPAHIAKNAEPGGFPEKGTAYFPPEGTHITFDTAGRFVASPEPPLNGRRPSVDVTFKSVARHYGPASIGVLLAGMGQDGADGLLDIHKAGGITIAQDEATSLVFGMPKRAIERGAARCVLPLDRMAEALVRLTAGLGERPCEEINNMARSKES
jgi:chemotaxis response regulator CheB